VNGVELMGYRGVIVGAIESVRIKKKTLVQKDVVNYYFNHK
jgi:hypothetical protein